MALPKSVCDNCINTKCLWRAPTGGSDPPVIFCPSKIEKPMTNADRIRQTTDEELAGKFAGACPDEYCRSARCRKYFHKGGCKNCWLDWLKSPVEDGE